MPQALVVSADDVQPDTVTPTKPAKPASALVVSSSDVTPDQPGQKPQLLGDSTKPAAFKPPETMGGFVKRQAKNVGKTVYEALPMIGGATGGAIGATVSAPTAAVSGPAGPITGGLVGAGVGGMFGRYTQHLIDLASGKAAAQKVGKDGKPVQSSLIGDIGQAATSQMEQQMGGDILAMPLGWVGRGGFLKNSAETMETQAANKAMGTRLSGPEIASGTHIGEITKSLQSYATGAFVAGRVQAAARAEGNKAAIKVVDDALGLLGHPGVSGGPTATSKGSAYAARSFVGELLDQAVEKAPPIDITAVKATATTELENGIVQHLKAVPDVANPQLARMIRAVRADPSLIQRLPRPAMTRLADVVLEKFKSPTMQLLRRIVGMEDQSAAKGVWSEIQSLGAMSKPLDELYSKDTAQRTATLLKGQLRNSLAQAAPELSQALTQYRDLARGDYLRENIVLGNKPFPKSEEGLNNMLTTMAGRLRKAVASGRIVRQFEDPTGQQVIRNMTAVANVLEKRTKPMSGMLRKVFELGRLMTIPVGAVTGHLPASTGVQAFLWEGGPDFFTWLIHDPKATQWFIEGVDAKDPANATSAVVRLMERFRQSHQQQTKPKGQESPQ